MPPLDPRDMEEYLPRAADRYLLNQQQQQSRDSPETGFWTDLDEGYYAGGGGASDGTGRGQWTIETVTIDIVGLIEYIFLCDFVQEVTTMDTLDTHQRTRRVLRI